MNMNIGETIDEVAPVREQHHKHGKTAGTSTTSATFQIIEEHRSDTFVAWSAAPPFWQDAVMSAIRNLGMDAALTSAALAEVKRFLERDLRR